MKIKNLTPHPVTINGVTYQPEGLPARIAEIKEEPIQLKEVRIERIFDGKIQNLPEPSECFYIVSRPIALAAHRPDVVCPYDYIRDGEGNITGAKSLAWFPPPELLEERN
jgi:hypothetical protein